MMGIGNADLERFLIFAVVLTILALLVRSVFLGEKKQAPQVPPTVAPLLHPRDEEVRELRHWRANMDQKFPDLTNRVGRQEEQISAVRSDLNEIKQTSQRTEHMMNLLLEHGLKGEQRP